MTRTEKLEADLQAAIQKNLPEQTVGVLRERLERLAELETTSRVLTENLEIERRETLESRKSLHAFREREGSIERRETRCEAESAALAKRAQACLLREGLIELREQHADVRVKELRGVLGDVFGNSQFKYRRTATVPVPVPGLHGVRDEHGMQTEYRTEPYVASGSVDETVEGEGEPPR